MMTITNFRVIILSLSSKVALYKVGSKKALLAEMYNARVKLSNAHITLKKTQMAGQRAPTKPLKNIIFNLDLGEYFSTRIR
jgi:hypothetical protein